MLHAYCDVVVDPLPCDRPRMIDDQDFAWDPPNTLRGVCDLVGLDFMADRVESWHHEHHHQVGGSRRTNPRYPRQLL